MIVKIEGLELIRGASPVSFCTGYVANSIEMEAGDFDALRKLALRNLEQFNAVMLQLENRFPENRVGGRNNECI